MRVPMAEALRIVRREREAAQAELEARVTTVARVGTPLRVAQMASSLEAAARKAATWEALRSETEQYAEFTGDMGEPAELRSALLTVALRDGMDAAIVVRAILQLGV